MPRRTITLLMAGLCAVLFGCSDKTGLAAKPDASLPDAASDIGTLSDASTDAANAADLSADTSGLADLLADALPDPAADAKSTVDPPPDGMSMPSNDAVSQDGYAVDVAVDTRASGDGSAEARPDIAYADACQAVANSTFLSVSELECGLTPTGTASCHWRLTFTDNGATRQVSWRLSDYMLTLSYTCSGFTINASSVSGGGPPFTGTYSPATDVLTWDGYEYTRESR